MGKRLKAVCINNSNFWSQLELGKEYLVEINKEGGVEGKEYVEMVSPDGTLSSTWFFSSRFKFRDLPESTEIKPVDTKAICLDNLGLEDHFEVGKEYSVVWVTDEMWQVIDDHGERVEVFAERFRGNK
jgi:hypothetical protein